MRRRACGRKAARHALPAPPVRFAAHDTHDRSAQRGPERGPGYRAGRTAPDADRPVAPGPRPHIDRGGGRRTPGPHARFPDLALALCSRRFRFRRHGQYLARVARPARGTLYHRPPANRRRTDIGGRHAQMADAFPPARRRPAGGDRDRLHSRGRARHAVHLEPGRLHAHLFLLPYRHPEAGPQPDFRGNPVAIAGGARPARRFPGCADASRRHRSRRGTQGHQPRRRRQPAPSFPPRDARSPIW